MENRIFTDVTIPSAFISLKKKFKVVPKLITPQLVAFEVQGEGIDQALSELYENPLVPLLDFIQAQKMLRASIFNLKKSGKAISQENDHEQRS